MPTGNEIGGYEGKFTSIRTVEIHGEERVIEGQVVVHGEDRHEAVPSALSTPLYYKHCCVDVCDMFWLRVDVIVSNDLNCQPRHCHPQH